MPGGCRPLDLPQDILTRHRGKVRGHAGTIGNAGIVWRLPIQTAPAHDPSPARGRPDRVHLRCTWVFAVPVGAPFRGTAQHGAKSPGIGCVASRGRAWRRICVATPSPCGIFPLRLGRQTVTAPIPCGEPGAERYRVIPTDACGRAPGRGSSVAGAKFAELFDAHLALREVERMGNRHLGAGVLIPIANPPVGRPRQRGGGGGGGFTHSELPGGYRYQPHAE